MNMVDNVSARRRVRIGTLVRCGGTKWLPPV